MLAGTSAGAAGRIFIVIIFPMERVEAVGGRGRRFILGTLRAPADGAACDDGHPRIDLRPDRVALTVQPPTHAAAGRDQK